MSLVEMVQSTVNEIIVKRQPVAQAFEAGLSHKDRVSSAIGQMQPLVECLEMLQSLDDSNRSQIIFFHTPGIDFDLFNPLDNDACELNLTNENPVLVIKYGYGVPFTPLYGHGEDIHVGRSGNAIRFFTEGTATAPSILVKMHDGQYTADSYLWDSGEQCMKKRSLENLTIAMLAAQFIQWLGASAPNRMPEFMPALQKLEAALPHEVEPARKWIAENAFANWLRKAFPS